MNVTSDPGTSEWDQGTIVEGLPTGLYLDFFLSRLALTFWRAFLQLLTHASD